MVSRVADELAHAVELLVAGKNQKALAVLTSAIVLLLDLVDELADKVEDTVSGPDPLPQVIGREARTGGRHRWIPRAAEAPLVERQEAGRGPD